MKRKWKLILGLLISYSTIQADIVFFQNGKVLENVRTKIKRDSVSILLPNDKSENYPKTAIKRIQLRPVQLTPIKTEADKLAYEREKIRVAEALQESADWEPLESEKLKVAVLNLQAGKGVEEGEVETIDELISINLVKTKLFSVIDRRSVDRTLSSKGDASCKSVKECDPKKIAELIGAAKVVTGIVTKVKGKYFINGNIVNAKTNTIDFAESSLAESPTKFQEASEYFAKKVAGGILVIYDANVTSRSKSVLPYVFRSAILPGWGQYKAGQDNLSKYQKWKGIGFGGAFLLAFVNLYQKDQTFRKEKSEFESEHNLFLLFPLGSGLEQAFYLRDRNQYSEFQEAGAQATNAFYILGGVYILNLIDSAFPDKRFLGIGKMGQEKTSGFHLNMKNGQSISQNNTNQKETLYEVSYNYVY